jgi:hypothetical protein
MYNPKRFGMYFPSDHESATLDHILSTQDRSSASPLQQIHTETNVKSTSTPAQDVIHRYRAGLSTLPEDGVSKPDGLHQQQSSLHSADVPPDTSYNWEYEPLALNRPIVKHLFSPSCEALFSAAVSYF